MELFTIVITHYNQEKCIQEALKSVLAQDYPRIELIITDDCSKQFPKEKIVRYIEKHKKNNLEHYDFIINTENLGTTKTMNKAIDLARGEYIQFFAADDALDNHKVTSNFVKNFHKFDEYVITSQCIMCGTTLEDKKQKFVNTKQAYQLNNESSFKQYLANAAECIYGSGGTAYRKEIFSKLGKFDEKYKLVEDWSYYLLLTSNGYKIRFCNFTTLLHRTGGVSHYKKKDIPPHLKQYYLDLLLIYENLVFPYFKKMNYEQMETLFNKYLYHVRYFDTKIKGLYQSKIPVIQKVKKEHPQLILRYYYYVFRQGLKNRVNTVNFHNLIYVFIVLEFLFAIYIALNHLDYFLLFVLGIFYFLSIVIVGILKFLKRRFLKIWNR